MKTSAAGDLRALVSLARHENYIAVSRKENGPFYSFPSVRLHKIVPPHGAGFYLFYYLLRSFRSRVVRRNDHKITQPRSDRAHPRPLAPIPVASASEDRDDLPLR